MARRTTPPDWVALSSPAFNRPLVPAVERLAKPLRDFAESLADSVRHDRFEDLYAPERTGLGFTLPPNERGRRMAWALVGEWLVAYSARNTAASFGLAATHAWFWEGHERATVQSIPELQVPLPAGTTATEVRALLPYLLDSMAAATRRDVLNARSTAAQRAVRKKAGVYYTPGDVAYLMVNRAMSATDDGPELWLDPAHGSGVFLRAVLSACGHQDMSDSMYGIDLDPMAAETTSFVLTAEDLHLRAHGATPWQRWHRFRRNLVTGDTLLLDAARLHDPADAASTPSDAGRPLGLRDPWRLETAFPEVAGKGFSRVVANPPYARLQPTVGAFHIPALHPVTGAAIAADVSPAFVEIAASVLTDSGAMAVVTPLSEMTSTRSPFPELRRHLTALPGSVEYLAFDRVPDALFGDDIKTRNAIIHVDKAASSGVAVSPLYRWTSRTRRTALGEVPTVDVTGVPGVPTTLPKMGSQWERELYVACLRHERRVDGWVTRRTAQPLDLIRRPAADASSDVVAVAPTAYNFIGVTRDPYRAVTDGHNSQNPLSVLQFKSEGHASVAYAVMCSRVAFWLWHITGDGFHVTTALTRLAPVPEDAGADFERLAELGDRLWKEALQRPTVSTNRSRITVTYPTWEHRDLLDDIDYQVLRLVGVPSKTSLAGWHDALVVVDADSDRRNIIRRNTL